MEEKENLSAGDLFKANASLIRSKQQPAATGFTEANQIPSSPEPSADCTAENVRGHLFSAALFHRVNFSARVLTLPATSFPNCFFI